MGNRRDGYFFGIFKNVALVILSVLIYNSSITITQVFGFFLASLGAYQYQLCHHKEYFQVIGAEQSDTICKPYRKKSKIFFLIPLFGLVGLSILKTRYNANLHAECTELRERHASILQNLRKNRFNQSPNTKDWQLGTGVNMIGDGCLTYRDRYQDYYNTIEGNELLYKCNRKYPINQKRLAFGIRISETKQYTTDFKKFLRSVISELGWNTGVDVGLLLYVEDKSHFDMNRIPPEFQSLVKIHDRFDIVKHFPTERIFLNSSYRVDIYPPVALYGHMTGLWFMKTHSLYDYMWNIEDDIRSTGSWELITQYFDNSQDFQSMWPYEYTHPSWMWDTDKFEQQDKFHGVQTVFGMSRRYLKAAEKELTNGNQAFLEVFLPSVAKKHNLTATFNPLPVYAHENGFAIGNKTELPPWVHVYGINSEIYHYRSTFDYAYPGPPALEFYNQWIDDTLFCVVPTLVHPVKL
jgi:hypothetical protein